MRFAYPVTVEADGGGYTLSFDGLPGATWAGSAEEAVVRAKELLVSSLGMLIEDGDEPPAPPHAEGRMVIEAELDPVPSKAA